MGICRTEEYFNENMTNLSTGQKFENKELETWGVPGDIPKTRKGQVQAGKDLL